MFSIFNRIKEHTSSHDKKHDDKGHEGSQAPPGWAPAPEISHTFGQYNESSDKEYQDGLAFCLQYPISQPSLVPSYAVDRIKAEGALAWGLLVPSRHDQYRFLGRVDNIPPDSKGQRVVHVATDRLSKDFCLLSDLPIVAGAYDIAGREGVYFEVIIHEMYPPSSFLAIGTACQPYPTFRLPGWNRESSGWHLDDLRKFFEDCDGGRDYTQRDGQPLPLPWNPHKCGEQYIPPGSTIGCGYVFNTGSVFYTFNGVRLPTAFDGVHLPRNERDVFAAIGVSGQTRFDVNFGGDTFRWLEGNEWHWRVEGVIGRVTIGESSGYSGGGDTLPAYSR